MINDFYNVIDPDKDERTRLTFEDFLKKRLIYIIKKYQNDLNPHNPIYPNADRSYYNITDFDRFFSKEKIFKIFNIQENDEILNSNNSRNEFENEDFEDEYVKLLARKNEEEFYKLKILYDVYKYEVYKDIKLGYLEVLQKLCCRCFASDKATKRYEIIDTAVEKLNLDVDFISIVNGIKDFERITEIYFEKYQSKLFNISNDQISSADLKPAKKRTKNGLIKGFGFSLLKIINEVNKKYSTLNIDNYNSLEKTNLKKEKENLNKNPPKNLKSLNFFKQFKIKSKVDQIKERRKMQQVKLDEHLSIYGIKDKNICCCFRKKKKSNNKIFRELNNLYEFEYLLEKLLTDGISNMDKKLLKDLGVEPETIANFSLYALNSENHNHEFNNKAIEELKYDSGRNIVNLVNKKFGNNN